MYCSKASRVRPISVSKHCSFASRHCDAAARRLRLAALHLILTQHLADLLDIGVIRAKLGLHLPK